MKKKGFTLVELLAVISILAILVIIALPNIMEMFKSAKESTFITEVKNIYKVAEEQWVSDSIFETSEKTYSKCHSDNCPNQLDLSGRSNIEYYVKINKSGKVTELYVTDGMYQYSYRGDHLLITDILTADEITDVESDEVIQIRCNSVVVYEPVPESSTLLMASSNTQDTANFLRTNIQKKDIETIKFTNNLQGRVANNTDIFDVSAGSNGSVLAWVSDNDGNGKYEVTIGSNGKVFGSNGDYLFCRFPNLTKIEGMEYFSTAAMTSMKGMFGFSKLSTLDFSHFNTSNVTDMSEMFGYAEFTSLDLSSFDTSKVTTMKGMFSGLKKLTSLNIKTFDTSNVTDMSNMFSGTNEIQTLDLRNFNTSKVTTMRSMFSASPNVLNNGIHGNGKRKTTSINVTSFDTSNVTDMGEMFYSCDYYESGYLNSLDVSGFNTSKVTNMHRMFANNSYLPSIDVSHFDTSKVTDMSYMFYRCSSITSLDLSHFDTSNVSTMQSMFVDDTGLTSLDLRTFDTSKVYSMESMFFGSYHLNSIKVSNSFTTSRVVYSNNMFISCQDLVGGAGTAYSRDNPFDKTYAHIDGGPSNPGYFTLAN